MSIVTSQQLARYFELYGSVEVTFNREVCDATGLLPKSLYLKVLDQQWPCIIYACSLRSAKVIASVRGAFFDTLRKSGSHVSLRLCFRLPDKSDPLSFFVPCRAAGFTPYNPENPDVQLIALEFTQRSPDDLILILGTLLEANATAARRREERIVLTDESMKKLGLESREGSVEVDGTRVKCILRDISFGGARILAGGSPALFDGKPLTLRIPRGGQREETVLAGLARRAEEVQGRADIVSVGIELTKEPPVVYKVMISSYLAGVRKPSPGSAAAPRARQAPHG